MWYNGRYEALTKGNLLTSPSPPEIREANAQEALLALLDEPVRAMVLSGEAYVVAGKKPDRPWVRKTGTHTVVQGQSPNVPDSAEMGKRTAPKQTATYREALESFLPMFKTDEEKLSFQRLVEKVMWGVEGAPQKVSFPCPHPETCPKGGKDHVFAWVGKPDLAVGFKLIELLAGRAAQTVNATIKSTNINVELEHRTFDVRLYDMSTQTAQERMDALIESGAVEREWLAKVIDTTAVASE